MSAPAFPYANKSFPIRQSEEHRASRRQFARFLGCALLASFGVQAARQRRSGTWQAVPPMAVAGTDEMPIGGSKLFRYPTADDPGILIRLGLDRYVAYSQSCTHLQCPVHFDSARTQLICPCHDGIFSAKDGRVLAGPPRRPLPRLETEVRGQQIWVKVPAETSG